VAQDKPPKVLPPEVKRLMEVAALKARLAQANQQGQQVVNLLAKYSEGLGRLLQQSRIVVDRETVVAEKHGPCPDVELGGFIKELRKIVYGMIPKEEEPADDAEEADAAGEGEPERPADGGVDAPGKGQAPEGEAAPDGAPAEGGAAPQADAPAQPPR
jgi:hypothetical protein